MSRDPTVAIPKNHSVRWGAILFSAALLLFVILVAGLSVAYLACSYHAVSSFYLGLNSCFFDVANWPQLFTPAVKASGNLFAAVAVLIAIVLIPLFASKFLTAIQTRQEAQYSCAPLHWTWAAALLPCIAAWFWGNSMALPANDELFSAVNFAAIHPLQAWSNYRLPNNHILFNIVNHFVKFGSWGVLSGRILSLIAYLGITGLSYLTLSRLFGNRLLAVVATWLVGLQGFTWGFSFQARAYEWYLLAEWGSVISGVCIALRATADNRAAALKWVRWNAFWVALGFCLLPSFMFWAVANVLFLTILTLRHKWLLQPAARYLGIAAGFVYLFYCPVLYISGLHALTANGQLIPVVDFHSVTDYTHYYFPFFQWFFQHIFGDITLGSFQPATLLLLCPLLLLSSRKDPRYFFAGLYYVTICVGYLLLLIHVRRSVFERVLLGHMSIGLVMAMITLVYFSDRIPFRALRIVVPASFFCLLLWRFIVMDPLYLVETFYGCPVNQMYQGLSSALHDLDKSKSITFTDNCFAARYICQEKGMKAPTCTTALTYYLLRSTDDPLPPVALVSKGTYDLEWKWGDFELYRLHNSASK